MNCSDLNVYFDGRLDNLRPVSSLVERLCHRLGLDETTSYHVELAVVEAVTNCMRYAFGEESESRPMHVAARVEEDALVISVTDGGEPVELDLELEPERRPPDELREGGRGLFLIRSLMDGVEHRSTSAGNILRMTKALR